MPTAPSTRTVLAKTREGLVKIENIPSDAKITFGPVQPGKQDYGSSGNALRIYTSNTNQLAVIVGVTEFRDESLTITRQVRTVRSKSDSEHGPKGSKASSETEYDIAWVDDGVDTEAVPQPVR